MKNVRFLGAALVALALIAAPVFAQQQAAHPAGKFLRCLTILGLSDQQKADIRTVLETEKPVLAGLAQTLKTDAAALKAALQATPSDPCAIGSALLKVHADREAIRTEREKVRTNVEAVLTPEQKLKFEGCLQSPRHAGGSPSLLDESDDELD